MSTADQDLLKVKNEVCNLDGGGIQIERWKELLDIIL